MRRVAYIGIFLDEESAEKLIDMQAVKLANIVPNIHCTFKYEPSKDEVEKFFETLSGRNLCMSVVGYASDGKNSGFKVSLSDEQLSVYTNGSVIDNVFNMRTPHITISLADGERAVNTGFLDFKDLENSFCISGVAGALMRDGGRCWVEYENPLGER